MTTLKIGSARHDENGKYSGGDAGDQTGTEVSTQAFYNHSKGWYVIRPIKASHAKKLASKMKSACSNSHIGYDQNQRLGIVTHGISTTTDTECDCSSLVRVCVKEATGKDPGNFTTATEVSMLEATGLFKTKFKYVSQSQTPLYNGDILCTCTKGHTAIVTSGNPRSNISPTYETGKTYKTLKSHTYNVVRTGPGKTYKKKTKSQLTANGKANSDAQGRIKKGVKLTCKGYKKKSNGNVWFQSPSGYMLAYDASTDTTYIG